ncbi:MAG: hypothetical protein IPK06_07730 [Ignavibacteriae bacterium]|nr:hypothetical protein [Ignavibacteriota bacterium]
MKRIFLFIAALSLYTACATDPEVHFKYKIIEIGEIPIKEFENNYGKPTEIIFTKNTYPYEGKVYWEPIGYKTIKTFRENEDFNNKFWIDTNSELESIETIWFSGLTFTKNEIYGDFMPSGPTLDAGASYFKGVLTN